MEINKIQMKGKNKEHIDWLLNELTKQASSVIFTHLPTKGSFDIRERIVEGLIGPDNKDALEITLELWFTQKLCEGYDSDYEFTKEHLVLKKRYTVTGDKEFGLSEFYDQFYWEILFWITCGQTSISKLQDQDGNSRNCYSVSHLIRQGLDNYKGWVK